MKHGSGDEIKVRVGRVIRTLREEAGLTLDGLASTARVSRGFLWAVEIGQKSASLETLEKLAAALEIDIHELLGPVANVGARRSTGKKTTSGTARWLARRVQALAVNAPADEIVRFDRIASDYFAPYGRRGKPDART